MDVVRLLVTDRGDVQVSEYVSSDRVGPPAHTHRCHEISDLLFWPLILCL